MTSRVPSHWPKTRIALPVASIATSKPRASELISLHAVLLDGAWHEQGGELVFEGLGHLKTSEVGEVLEGAVRRIER